MVARAFSETSGKISSRTSPRSEDDAEALGAFADGNVSVRTEAGVGAASAELSGSAARFFWAVFSESRVADGSEAARVSRRAGCSIASGCAAGWAEAVEADDEPSERWPRIFGSAKMATITRSTAATGTTYLGRTRVCLGGFAACERGGCGCALVEGTSNFGTCSFAAATAGTDESGTAKGETDW